MEAGTNSDLSGHAASTWRRQAWMRLLTMLFLAGAGLGLLVVLSRKAPAPPKRAFDARPLVALRRQKPHFVLLGNSMVPTRFDPRLLNRLLRPRRATIIANGGSKSAVWYLYFKNYLIPSGVRPQRVILFFRSSELTEPRERAVGPENFRVQRVSHEEEPLVERKLRPPLAEPIAHLAWWLDRLAPVSRLEATELAEYPGLAVANRLAPGQDAASIKGVVNSMFSLAALRDATAPPEPDVKEDERTFSEVLEASFLREIVELARHAKFPLLFVHVRSRAAADGIQHPPALKTYLRDLESYLEKEGCEFIDMTTATWETPDLYGNGDHIAARHRATYTRLFVERMPEVFR